MKTRLLKSAVLLVLICILAFSLTGCDGLDYREAIDLYNRGNYAEAVEIFSQLGDYEDSARLEQLCYYWMATDAMEQRDYPSAIQQFQALRGYKDSDARITECQYLLAVTLFEGGDLSGAEEIFLELADYKQTAEYLRWINWQNFFDAVAAAGTESGGSFTLQKEADSKVYSITADMAEPSQLIFFVSSVQDMGYTFHDDLTLTLTRDSKAANFTATSTFSMEMNGNQIGSRQEASGKLDITTCTPETKLVMETFEKHVEDNQGNIINSTDPADSLMNDAVAENMYDLMTAIPEILAESGIALTLRDIGFYALQ